MTDKMILHTIMDPGIIFYNESDYNHDEILEIDFKDIKLAVKMSDDKTCVINKIITTNMEYYLKPEIQPGTILSLSMKPRNL